MSRYIDADRLRKDILGLPNCYNGFSDTYDKALIIDRIDEQPTANVRENIHAQKVIGGGERDGATCWFECSHCHGTVDILDAYCKHCGAVLELENDL